jgi:hypothetical protein
MTTEQRQVARTQAADMVRARGTGKKPLPPRDVFLQSGPRGILVNWLPAVGFTSDIAGWRIYKDNETSLFAEIRDPNTTQHFVETTSASTPPVTNVFVSSINKLGVESTLIQAQGSAVAEAGAPVMPPTPPTFTTPYTSGAGGTGASGGGGHRELK